MRICKITGYSGTRQNKNLRRDVCFKSAFSEHFSQGAKYSASQGTKFTLQTPFASHVSLLISKNNDYKHIKMYPLYKKDDKFSGIVKDVSPGDKYKYVVLKSNGEYFYCYDPRADFLPNDVDSFPNSEWCEVIDHKQFKWSDEEWMKNRAIKDNRGWHLPDDMILESLHIGLLGGFKEAKKEIDNIVQKGIANTIRIMPIGEFYGGLNWGYDEVAKFAPENSYGRPDDLKDFVNYAHKNNIRVILDVVPNHFGSIGCVVHKLMPSEGEDNEWGKGLKFKDDDGKYMKSYMTDMLMNWAVNYHIDGFRLDATHKIDNNLMRDTTIQEINKDLKSHKETEDVILYAEDMRLSRVLTNEHQPKTIYQKHWGLNGITDFDFYKCLIALAKGSSYDGIEGDLSLLKHLYKHGIRESHEDDALRASGTDRDYREFCQNTVNSPDMSAKNLLVNLSNHDEIGNQGGGKRNLLSILYVRLGMYSRTKDNWKASQNLLFDMLKYYFTNNEVMPDYLQREKGSVNPVDKGTFEGELAASFALNKLMIGATLLNLSPKEFFMGDDECELAPFKFFATYNDTSLGNMINSEKGYDIGRPAFEDSKLHNDYSNAKYIKYKRGTTLFTQDFLNTVKRYNIQTECTPSDISTYEHKNANIFELKYQKQDGTELIAVMNFSGQPQDKFTLRTTSEDTNLRELINSNSEKYGGSNWFLNSQNNNLQAKKVIIPPQSIVVFEKK